MEYLQYDDIEFCNRVGSVVLNLVINGIPSILKSSGNSQLSCEMCFKPCYKWNTFNTNHLVMKGIIMPSFKPCYKWNTFNTISENEVNSPRSWYKF